MAEKQKILISGDAEGRFDLLFSKVNTINKKNGPFDFLLCVGNFFGVNNSELLPYKNGTKKITVPTFIIGPNRDSDIEFYPEEDGCEICQNLTYLGKRGLYNAESGLKLAYLSGIEKDDKSSQSSTTTITENDVISVRNSCLKGQPCFRGIDILMTSQWPLDITKFDGSNKVPDNISNGSKLIAWLAAQTKPRYHVCALEGIHYERPPYRNQSSNDDNIEIATRFVALARVGNKEKHKWLYALNLTPVDRTRLTELAIKTTDETTSPYPASTLASHPSATTTTTTNKKDDVQFFYDMETQDDKKKRYNNQTGQDNKKRKVDFDQGKCWFCLSSPKVSKHLVISVGNESYLALAKGGLVDDHFLILPISHHQSFSIVPESILNEMELYKKSIKRYFSGTNRVPVFFERNFKSSHCQLQAVPVPKNSIPIIKEMFQEMAQENNIELNDLPRHSQLQQIAPPGTTYFYVELPDGDKLYCRIKKDFPLQFGREVLASDPILNLNERIDWKDCQISEQEETQLAQNIKIKFKPYDIET